MEISLDVNLDIISNLPANVTDQILIRLPIGDAVRTSVLSTKWRYRWTTITQLVFHDNQVLPSPHNNKDKLINFIDRVLLLHSGFIRKFELSTQCLASCPTIDCWILFLSRKNIKEFVLNFSAVLGREQYKLPTCFFSAQQISTLELHCCVLKKPPPTFTGFSYLKSLVLHNTTFVDKGGFECLISKCPLLERLTLDMIDGIDHLNICSPNLKYLSLIGSFKDICFENTPLLSDVSINTAYLDAEEIKKSLQSETGNLVKVFSSLPKLRKFMGGFIFVQFLAVGKIPEKLPFTCHHLNNLSLQLDFECVNHMGVTLFLLNSSPNLRQLEIQSLSLSEFCHMTHNSQNLWEGRSLVDWNMSGLQIVKITNIKGFELELEFIKLLLANSPMLEMLSIGLSGKLDNDRIVQILKELLIFPRASPKAKIKFLEKHEK